MSSITIRVLHIFAPNFRHRFGGPIFDWKYAFSSWSEPEIEHLVLDCEQGKILKSKEAFTFPISNRQYIAPRWERFKWIFSLIYQLSILKKHFDVIHVHVPWWGGFLSGVWASLNHIPSIYQTVLLNEDTPTGLLNEIFGNLQVWCLRKFTSIFAISESLANDYLQHGFETSRVFTMMNPVNSEVFYSPQIFEKKESRNELGLPPEKKVLLFVGSINERKGVDTLIDAFIRAKEEIDDLYLILVGAISIGENPSLNMAFIQKIKKRIIECSIDQDVIFTGLITDREQLGRIYRAADIFVFPSRNEGMPNVVLEAMASGLPVVVSRLPALQSVIAEGENGVFVPLDDSAALAKTINGLWYDWDKTVTLGQHAAEYVRSHHHFDQWQDQMVGFYRRLYRSTGQAGK